MFLKHLSILNYKNIVQAELSFTAKINCFIGKNGEGKTNLLDAIYYLAFCKSATNSIDNQVIEHNADFFMLDGLFETTKKEDTQIYCALKRKHKKQFKCNDVIYKKMSEHIGKIPLILVSPLDSFLISDGSENRRNFLDHIIAQYNKPYLQALIRYKQALQQRNALLKIEETQNAELYAIYEEILYKEGLAIYESRKTFLKEFIPQFKTYYKAIAGEGEEADLQYISQCETDNLLELLQKNRHKEQIIGHTRYGVHKDELQMLLGGYPIKREGSQGQNKTFLIALKLAQLSYLSLCNNGELPILLLDDIFDKLDADRVERILNLVSTSRFGQIFITDTNREHLDKLTSSLKESTQIFKIEKGIVMT